MGNGSRIGLPGSSPESWRAKNKPIPWEDIKKLAQNIISTHRWTYREIGRVWDRSKKAYFYLVLMDNKAIIITKDVEVNEIPLTDISISPVSFKQDWCICTNGLHQLNAFNLQVSNYTKNEIVKYIDSLVNFTEESTKELDPTQTPVNEADEFIKRVDSIQESLILNDEARTLLKNFLDMYSSDFFKQINLAYIYEDELLNSVFRKKRQFEFETTFEMRNGLEEYLPKLLDILFKKGLIPKDFTSKSEYRSLLLLRCLRSISMDHFSVKFRESYGGYFDSVEGLSVEECTEAYFSIDFIEKTDVRNIGFLTYYLYSCNDEVRRISDGSLLKAFNLLKEKIEEFDKNKELLLFERQLLKGSATTTKNGYENCTIDDVDLMTGTEFEDFLYDLFQKMGYTVHLTRASGDQGIDLIAVKNGVRIGVQAKRYSNSVSNKAVQEVVAGMKYYNLSKTIVITNNYFTKSAIELGITNEVVLWDRDILKEKITELYQ